MRYTENGLKRIIGQHERLEDICYKIVKGVDIAKIKDVRVCRVDIAHCGDDSFFSTDFRVWRNPETCVVVKYLPVYSSSDWKYFNIPIRWLTSESAIEEGIEEYKTKTKRARRDLKKKKLDEEIESTERRLASLKAQREGMDK